MESRSFNKLMYQKECFSDVARLYISFNNFLFTRASISSRIDSNSFELRWRQISIQQKWYSRSVIRRGVFELAASNCTQGAFPWQKDWSGCSLNYAWPSYPHQTATNTKTTYPFFVFLCFKCAFTFLCRSINFSNVPGSQQSLMVCSSSGTRMCMFTCLCHAPHAGSTPGAQLGENTYTLG